MAKRGSKKKSQRVAASQSASAKERGAGKQGALAPSAKGQGALLFHIQLAHVHPAPWRRIRIAPSSSLWDLHNAIQVACGWESRHLLHYFEGDNRKVPAAFERQETEWFGIPVLRWFLPELGGALCGVYLYDWGDHWEHILTLEGQEERPMSASWELLDQAGDFPREDMGGVAAFHATLDAQAARLAQGISKKMQDLSDPEIQIIQAATSHPQGLTVTSGLACTKRPNRKKCGGFLNVLWEGPSVHWECTACEAKGFVHDWQGTSWDRTEKAPSEWEDFYDDLAAEWNHESGKSARDRLDAAVGIVEAGLEQVD